MPALQDKSIKTEMPGEQPNTLPGEIPALPAKKVDGQSDEVLLAIQNLAATGGSSNGTKVMKVKSKNGKVKSKGKKGTGKDKKGTGKGKKGTGKSGASKTGDGKKRKFNIPFPGKPKKGVPPIEFGQYRIYTDANKFAWRVKRVGLKNDKAFPMGDDPKATWDKMADLLSEGKIGMGWK